MWVTKVRKFQKILFAFLTVLCTNATRTQIMKKNNKNNEWLKFVSFLAACIQIYRKSNEESYKQNHPPTIAEFVWFSSLFHFVVVFVVAVALYYIFKWNHTHTHTQNCVFRVESRIYFRDDWLWYTIIFHQLKCFMYFHFFSDSYYFLFFPHKNVSHKCTLKL